jgi:hypothetical protein
MGMTDLQKLLHDYKHIKTDIKWETGNFRQEDLPRETPQDKSKPTVGV